MAEKLEVEKKKFLEKIETAKVNQNYIKLGDKRGTLLLSGAAAKWKADPSFVYVPTLRVAGRPSDIEKVFVDMELFSSGDIKAHIKAGYSADAHGENYESELEKLKGFKETKKGKGKAVVSQMKHPIHWYAERLDEFVVKSRPATKAKSPKKGKGKAKAKSPKKRASSKSPAKKRASSKSPAKKRASSKSPAKKRASSKSPAKKRGPKPLADKIENLSEGKVMDVSSFRSNGEGAHPIKEPGSKSKKFLVPGTRIVSDSKIGIKAAAKALGDDSLVAKWEEARSGRAVTPKSGSPKRSQSPAEELVMPGTPPIGSLQTTRSPKDLPKLKSVKKPTIESGSPKSPRM